MAIRYLPVPATVTMGSGTTARRPQARRLSKSGDDLRRRRNFKSQEHQEMIWETPQAIDMRLGMEITMYIATR